MVFRVALYLVFILVAAPFEILLDFWGGIQIPDPELKWRPIAQGLVYLYAFILTIETWFRLQQDDEVLRIYPKLKAVQVLCVVLILAFMFDYMGAVRIRLMFGQTVADSADRQLALAGIAFACSITSYIMVERFKRKRGVGT